MKSLHCDSSIICCIASITWQHLYIVSRSEPVENAIRCCMDSCLKILFLSVFLEICMSDLPFHDRFLHCPYQMNSRVCVLYWSLIVEDAVILLPGNSLGSLSLLRVPLISIFWWVLSCAARPMHGMRHTTLFIVNCRDLAPSLLH